MKSASLSRLLVVFTLTLCLVAPSTCHFLCANFSLPARCTCSDVDVDLTKVSCIDAGLTSLPAQLPPAVDVVIENNTIDVVDVVPYGAGVRYLYLSRNGIRLIRDGAFRSLVDLESLSLASNELTGLRRATFAGLERLRTLRLVGNPLYVLRAGTFVGSALPRLENLDLDDCALYEFEDSAVDGLGSLLFLTLSGNRLRRAPVLRCAETPFDRLTTLDLSRNAIDSLPSVSSCRLPGLRHLNLDRNRLSTLTAGFLGPSVPGLETLYVRHNELVDVDVDAFSRCPNLTIVDLSHNKLVALDNRTVPWQSLRSFIVGYNPWRCDCANLWLVTESAVKEHNSDDSLRCSTPQIVQNVSVFSAYESVFEQCVVSSRVRVLPIAIGIFCGLAAVSITCVVIYFAARKRSIRYPLVGMAAPRAGSSVYRRMSTGNEVIFDYTSSVLHVDQAGGGGGGSGSGQDKDKPVWKEMSTYGRESNPATA